MANNDLPGCAVAAALLYLAAFLGFWGAVAFVAVHFVGKFW